MTVFYHPLPYPAHALMRVWNGQTDSERIRHKGSLCSYDTKKEKKGICHMRPAKDRIYMLPASNITASVRQYHTCKNMPI